MCPTRDEVKFLKQVAELAMIEGTDYMHIPPSVMVDMLGAFLDMWDDCDMMADQHDRWDYID